MDKYVKDNMLKPTNNEVSGLPATVRPIAGSPSEAEPDEHRLPGDVLRLPKGIKLRLASPADAQSLAALDELCFSIPWTETMFLQELSLLDQAHYLILEQEQIGIIGYGGYWQVLDEAQIMNIAVHPSWSGQGLATAILTGLIGSAQAADLKLMSLEVREGNEPARRLYRRLGFQESGLRPGYYADNGENAIIMFKNIV